MTKTPQAAAWYNRYRPMTHVLGRYPAWAGNIAGFGIAVFLLLVFVAAAIALRLQQIEEGHERVHQRMQEVMVDSSSLLDELNARYRPDCDPENLKRLNALMYGHRYIRGIGLLDDQRRVFCSTGAGRLDEPAPAGTNGIDGSIGRYQLGTPVRRFVGPVPDSVRGTVVERGRFQVLIDGTPTGDAAREYSDAMWAGAGAQRRRIYASPAGSAMTEAVLPPDTPELVIDWRHARLYATNTVPGVSPVSVQSVLGLHSLDAARLRIFAVVTAFCALLGLVLSKTIARYCRGFQSMDHRIRHLCSPDKVVCHYQPILELATGRMIGCEVLARLRDGDKLIYPDKFIPALNRRKLTWAFDAAVSRAALLELAEALPAQRRFAVALNFFPQNLRRDTIHDHLRDVMAGVGRDDLQIELEVTEYDFSPELAPELRRLKADGYGISIDDFGTGYSNLGMVKKVSPDFLKIDRSFVLEMGDETIRSSLIPEIIAIATAVGSEVIAEGIETADQLEQLRALGVRYGQGYFFARPMAMADLQRFMATNVTAEAPPRSADAFADSAA